jgi:hypothetical protein
MRPFVLTCLVVCGGHWLGAPVFGGEAEDLFAQARKAQLGADELRTADVRLKFKGTLFHARDVRPAFQGDFLARPDDRDRLSIQVEFDTAKIGFTVLGTQGAVKRHPEGDIGDITPNEYIQTARTLEPLRSALLSATLRPPPPDQVEPLGESKVGDRAVRGVRIAPPDQPPRRLYFDKETGRLLKVALADQKFGERSIPVEIVFSGYTDTVIGAAEEQTLKEAGVAADGAAVVDYLRKQKPKAATEEAVKALIAKLGDDDFDVREQATKDLARMGAPALPLLERAAKSPDLEVSRRAECLVELITARNYNATAIAAVRVLGRRKPAGAAEVLLDSLGWAGEDVAAEIYAALAGLATREGKTDPALEKALADKDEKRRRAAEAALGKDGGAYLKKASRRLYPDGGRFPAKAGIFVDGKLAAEIEFLDVHFVHRPDGRASDKP